MSNELNAEQWYIRHLETGKFWNIHKWQEAVPVGFCSQGAGEYAYHSDQIRSKILGDVAEVVSGEDLINELKHKPYVWTVEIHIDPIWVADGFDLDEDRLEEMLMQELTSARGDEVGGKILKAPDPKQIRAEQGGVVPGYKPRNPDL